MTDPLRVWVIRANDGRWAETFATNGYIGLHHGMDGVDMSGVRSRDEVRRLFEQEHAEETSARSIGNRAGQVANYHLEIKSGDYVLTPGLGSEVRYGRFSTNGSYYVSIDDRLPTRNRRLVEWSSTRLNRHDLPSAALQGGTTLYEVKNPSGLLGIFDPFDPPPNPNVWIVRGGRQASAVEQFIAEDYTGIGFNLQHDDLSMVADTEGVKNVYLARNPDGTESAQIVDFCLNIEVGDYVLMPGPGSQVNFFGQVKSDLFHDPRGPYENRRTVEWSEQTISREELDLSGYRPTVTRPNWEVQSKFFELIDERFPDTHYKMPEDSWVPFHLEVGRKLVEGEWWREDKRDRFARMVHDIRWADPGEWSEYSVYEEWPGDPYSFYLSSNMRMVESMRVPAHRRVKELLDIKESLPSGDYHTISMGVNWGWETPLDDHEVKFLWDLFRLVWEFDPANCDPEDEVRFIEFYDRAASASFLRGRRAGWLSIWLYWIDATKYVATRRLSRSALNLEDELGVSSGLPTGRDYLDALRGLRELGASKGFSILDVNRLSSTRADLGLDDVGLAEQYTVDDMIKDGVFFERTELERILGRFEDKKNLILQGPPGVGKTFVTRRFAYALIGQQAFDRVRNVQFHQSYSYEDFVEGFRPETNADKQLIFERQPGTFLKMCEDARINSNLDYVIVVDEINRGNLSRVFGELLSLIEKDKRGEKFEVTLASGRRFSVPENVYILGTMNLADRSLAGIDYAMRRRFAFVTLKPQFGESVFEDWLRERGVPGTMIERINSRMSALNGVIAGDASLGRNFAVGHSYFCDIADGGKDDWDGWYREIVKTEIQPLLEEYWFDNLTKADVEVENLLSEL